MPPVKIFLTVFLKALVSKELWFSWLFLLLGGITLYSICTSDEPLWQAVKGVSLLIGTAMFFAAVGTLMGYHDYRQEQMAAEQGNTVTRRN